MAERLVLYMFKQDKEKSLDFANSLIELKNLKSCQRCFNISEDDLCWICQDTKRSPKILCVVEEPLDIISIEKTKIFNGYYHVLGGIIYNDSKSQELKIPELMSRIKNEGIEEVIIATNPTTEGDATAFYLKKKMQDLGAKVTRLGRGMATGGDIEYADEVTLSSALTNRKELL